ncbi:hypothetical protein SNE510_27830 [Streptomyces sp. NE5-10]|nr:hypothetical protein SNE510_27830 [Streptomyces sp. NE5-10]
MTASPGPRRAPAIGGTPGREKRSTEGLPRPAHLPRIPFSRTSRTSRIRSKPARTPYHTRRAHSVCGERHGFRPGSRVRPAKADAFEAEHRVAVTGPLSGRVVTGNASGFPPPDVSSARDFLGWYERRRDHLADGRDDPAPGLSSPGTVAREPWRRSRPLAGRAETRSPGRPGSVGRESAGRLSISNPCCH